MVQNFIVLNICYLKVKVTLKYQTIKDICLGMICIQSGYYRIFLMVADNTFQETFKLRDVTEDVKAIIKCVKDLTTARRNSDYTLIHFVEMFKGDYFLCPPPQGIWWHFKTTPSICVSGSVYLMHEIIWHKCLAYQDTHSRE